METIAVCGGDAEFLWCCNIWYILSHVDPLLGNDGEITIQQPLPSNGSANNHISTARIALQQRNGVFYAVHADMLYKLGVS
jgi:hypothetical protein